MTLYSRQRQPLENPPWLPRHCGFLNNAPARATAPAIPIAIRGCRNAADSPWPSSRTAHGRASANFHLSLAPGRIIPLCFSLFLGSSPVAVLGHLRFDFHPAVEFLLRHPPLALRVALLFDRVEDAAQFR
jgi:hypothetical protein